jgi:hypothetical protein
LQAGKFTKRILEQLLVRMPDPGSLNSQKLKEFEEAFEAPGKYAKVTDFTLHASCGIRHQGCT